MKIEVCPHCGNDAIAKFEQNCFGERKYWIECQTCGAQTEKRKSLEDAASNWNRRTPEFTDWIGESDGYADGAPVYDIWICAKCGFFVDENDDEPPAYKFCPECGRKFRGRIFT